MQSATTRAAFKVPVLTLEEITEKTQDLPTLPAAALAVMREVDSPEATAQSVARQLASDQSLSARVLRLANSAFYGLQRQVMDVPEAVVILGMRSVKNLSMVAATYPWLSRPLAGYALEPMALWRHSFSVAVGSQMLSQRVKSLSTDSAFTAGLLHDLGKLALSVWLEDRLTPVIEIARRAELPLIEVEKKVLGFDHAEVGAIVGELWNLPPPLVETMRFHHRPDDVDEPSALVDCVHVAEYLTVSLGLGIADDGLRHDFSPCAFERLGFKLEDTDELAAAVAASVEEHQRLFAENLK